MFLKSFLLFLTFSRVLKGHYNCKGLSTDVCTKRWLKYQRGEVTSPFIYNSTAAHDNLRCRTNSYACNSSWIGVSATFTPGKIQCQEVGACINARMIFADGPGESEIECKLSQACHHAFIYASSMSSNRLVSCRNGGCQQLTVVVGNSTGGEFILTTTEARDAEGPKVMLTGNGKATLACDGVSRCPGLNVTTMSSSFDGTLNVNCYFGAYACMNVTLSALGASRVNLDCSATEGCRNAVIISDNPDSVISVTANAGLRNTQDMMLYNYGGRITFHTTAGNFTWNCYGSDAICVLNCQSTGDCIGHRMNCYGGATCIGEDTDSGTNGNSGLLYCDTHSNCTCVGYTCIIESIPTQHPFNFPSMTPTKHPSTFPSISPTLLPSFVPSSTPTNHPSIPPSESPSSHPILFPTQFPSFIPSISPTKFPFLSPTTHPSHKPSPFPSLSPSTNPSTTTLSPQSTTIIGKSQTKHNTDMSTPIFTITIIIVSCVVLVSIITGGLYYTHKKHKSPSSTTNNQHISMKSSSQMVEIVHSMANQHVPPNRDVDVEIEYQRDNEDEEMYIIIPPEKQTTKETQHTQKDINNEIEHSQQIEGEQMDVKEWEVFHVIEWLQTQVKIKDISTICDTFEKNQINGESLLLLNKEFLNDMEIPKTCRE